jgi:hypothetical protein
MIVEDAPVILDRQSSHYLQVTTGSEALKCPEKSTS